MNRFRPVVNEGRGGEVMPAVLYGCDEAGKEHELNQPALLLGQRLGHF
jgi:hypothetical protein